MLRKKKYKKPIIEGKQNRDAAYVVLDRGIAQSAHAIVAVCGSRWQAKQLVGECKDLYIIVKKRITES